jgi:hypothetical protein
MSHAGKTLVALIAACALAFPSSAGAVTFGADLSQGTSGTMACGGSSGQPCSFFTETRSTGEGESGAPISGILTSIRLRHQGISVSVSFRVLRPQGGLNYLNVAPETYAIVPAVGTSGGSVTQISTRLPIQAGDRLGIGFAYPGAAGVFSFTAEGFPRTCLFRSGAGSDHPPGATATYTNIGCTSGTGKEVLIAGTVEPDGDGDQLGDESQDNCPSVPNPGQENRDGDAQGDACDGDRDGDGEPDGSDAFPDDPSEQFDSDRDGKGDNADPDDDNDGLEDAVEAQRKTNRLDVDSDDDGLSDSAEVSTNPVARDSDGDTVSDGVELGVTSPIADPPGAVAGTDPTVFQPDRDQSSKTLPTKRDSDSDGVLDGREDRNQNGRVDRGEIDPLRRDTDNDRIRDGREDRNRNGLFDRRETNPRRRDTDRDGIPDGKEDRNRNGRVDRRETDPRKRDTDRDGVSDRRDRRPYRR